MRVGIVSMGDPADVRTWSGIPVNMAEALRRTGVEVFPMGPLAVRWPRAHYLLYLAAERAGRADRTEFWPTARRHWPRLLATQARELRLDVILSTAALPVSTGAFPVPVAIWTDATFRSLVGFYPEFTGLPKRVARWGDEAEDRGLSRSRRLFYSSRWAADSAQRDYGVPPEQIVIAPFGANLRPPAGADIDQHISARPSDVCRLLFIGAHWERKRGDFAVEVARLLNDRGVVTSLTMIGARPPHDGPVPDYVQLEGFVSKDSAAGREKLSAAFFDAHFLILPSLADCSPIVIPEANAHGLPCIAAAVGGIPEIVRTDVNGIALPPTASPSDYASAIAAALEDVNSYRDLARQSLDTYASELNWDVSARRVADALRAELGE